MIVVKVKERFTERMKKKKELTKRGKGSFEMSDSRKNKSSNIR